MKDLAYQQHAIRKLESTSNELLNSGENNTLIFKAPTGSGKTVMMAEFLKEFVSNRIDGKEFSFIWAAPRKLHSQSKKKLTDHYEDSKALKCSSFYDLSADRMIGPNEILFLNWESINRDKNIFYRENEEEFYLEKIIENTKDDGRIVVLIIDESHHTAGAEKTQGLVGMIDAKLTIGVSATPSNINLDGYVGVRRQEVIDEEMIKKEIAINPSNQNTTEKLGSGDVTVQSDAKESTKEKVVALALEKREDLAQQFSTEKSPVNPLMLIQLPNISAGITDLKDEIAGILKDNHDITTDNGKLAVYLAEDKENLATITKEDSPVEVMLFKQAIALGWDCPRASILVLFREHKNFVFSTQTIGRIMRMPELKHYDSNDLNGGYIYTNLADVSIHQEIADGYATVHHSRRNNDIYEEIELLSCHSVRQKERTRLAPKFTKIFLEAAEELELKNKISITGIDPITNTLIRDATITDSDEEVESLAKTSTDHKTGERQLNENEIDALLHRFSADALSPDIYPDDRSIKRINKSIYDFFKKEFPELDYDGLEGQSIVLSPTNQNYFLDVVNLAKENYLAEVKQRARELAIDENWEVPGSLNYSENFVPKSYDLSIMQPFYEGVKASNVEKNFAEFLNDRDAEIVWWFKNGERDGTFFAVPRKKGDEDVPFYVDWIVKYKDGRIGLFETKAGITAKTAGSRAKGLVTYIEEQNANGKKLFGGIVIEKNDSFWINSDEEYKYDENDLPGSGWKVFQ